MCKLGRFMWKNVTCVHVAGPSAGLLHGINTLDSENKEIICLFNTKELFQAQGGYTLGKLQHSRIFSTVQVKSLV